MTQTLESRLRARGWRGLRRIRPEEGHPDLRPNAALIEATAEAPSRLRYVRSTLDRMEALRRRVRGARPGSQAKAEAETLLSDLRASLPVRSASCWAVFLDAKAETIIWRCSASPDALRSMADSLRDEGVIVLFKPRPRSDALTGRVEATSIPEADVSLPKAEANVAFALDRLACQQPSAISFAEGRARELDEARATVIAKLRLRGAMLHEEREALLAKADSLASQASLLRTFAETGKVPHHRSAAYGELRMAIIGGDSRH
jgi:hypothetical protein